MPKMKIAVVPKRGADFEMHEREIPQPPAGHLEVPPAILLFGKRRR